MTDHTPSTEDWFDSLDADETTFTREALTAHNRKIAAKALRTEAFSGLYGTFAQERLLTRADRIEQGGES